MILSLIQEDIYPYVVYTELFTVSLALLVVKTFGRNIVLPAPFLFAQRTAVGFQNDLIPLTGTDLK